MTVPNANTPKAPITMPASILSLLKHLHARAEQAGVFDGCQITGAMLTCKAKDAGDDAEYRLSFEDGQLWACLVTPGRYLSQSIEQDLVHSGDKAGDLLRDELIDLGAMTSHDEPMPAVEHFRSVDKLYTFRTPLGINEANAATPASMQRAGDYLMGYVQTFSHLGDMAGGEE